MYVDATANSVFAEAGNDNGERMGVCDVHRLIDGDTRPRLVQFCSLCQSWLCKQCRFNPVRRARAAMKARLGR